MKKKIKKISKKLNHHTNLSRSKSARRLKRIGAGVKKKFFNFDDIKYIYILAGVVFLTSLLLIGWFGYQFLQEKLYTPTEFVDQNLDEKKDKECDHKRKLDGVCVDSDREINPELIMVMIENNLEAWPLSGIADAQVVYEAPVEGNIPRFMAIYTNNTEVDQAGPVRSARPYYLDWASEYGNAMYMHVGGSPEALEKINAYNLFNINEFYRDWYFWRSSGRDKPHNTYTSTELWNKALDDYGEYNEREDYDGWVFKKMEECTENCISEIDVPIASWRAYHAIWKFDTSTQQYTRYQNKTQQFDMDGTAVVADTVVVQRVKAVVIDEIGRKKIDTLGSGDVVVFRNGKAIEGQWFKESRRDRTQWYNENGDIIPLQAGKIWVEILPDNRDFDWE